MKTWIKFLLILTFLSGCDFSPRVNKKILEAQDYIKSQQIEKAIDLYKRILETDLAPEVRVKLYFQMGELYMIYFGKYQESIEYFEKIKDVTDSPAWLIKVEEKLGELNLNFLKNYKSASVNYKKLVDFLPKLQFHDRYQFKLAQSYYNSGNYNETINVTTEILENKDHSHFVDAIYLEGLALFQKNDYENASKAFREYLRRETKKQQLTQAKFLLANCLEIQEDLKKAYNIYYSILGDYPNIEVVRNRLKSIYLRKVARKR